MGGRKWEVSSSPAGEKPKKTQYLKYKSIEIASYFFPL